MKTLGAILLSVALFLGLMWFFQGNGFFIYKIFAPKYEQTRREVFEQSKAYNQGLQQELDSFYLEYAKADPEHKKAIATVALHRVADYDIDLLPPHLKSWISDLRRMH